MVPGALELPGRLVLASASPRRRELLRLLGAAFEVVEPVVEELEDGDPGELVATNAERKARAGAELAGAGATVIGCDTDVVLDSEVLGKPRDRDGARRRLLALSGRTHRVLSGLCVLAGERRRAGTAETTVRFRELDEAAVEAYVESGEWEDRAGGYAVQGLGSSLIAAIDGDLSNVIGLPVPLLLRLLSEGEEV